MPKPLHSDSNSTPSEAESTKTRSSSKRRHRKSRASDPVRRVTFPWRRFKLGWSYWKPSQLLGNQLSQSTEILKSIVVFQGTDYRLKRADGRVLMRVWPSTKTLFNPLWWLTSGVLFVWRWFLTRKFMPMLLAVPAVLAAVGLLGALSAGGSISDGTHSLKYKQILAKGIDGVEFDLARLAMDAVIQLDPGRIELAYDRALLEDKYGDRNIAYQIMVELANSGKSSKAALWLVQVVAAGKPLTEWTREQIETSLGWLNIAVQNAPSDPAPRRLIAELQRFLGNSQLAYEALLPIANTDTDISYGVYFLQRELGYNELAEVRGLALERTFEARLTTNEQDLRTRLQFSRLLASEKRYDEAFELLKKGQLLTTQEDELPLLQNAIVGVMLLQASELNRVDKSMEGTLQRFRILKEALQISADNQLLLQAISEACIEAAESQNDELVVLRDALVQDVDSDTAHFILGTIALNRGQIEEAKVHLEQVAQSMPNLPGILNNLAFAISHSDNPDLPRALRFADAAVARMPEHAYLRETRGQIHLMLKNYAEAITDLELALSATELRPQVREGLAQAYEATGLTEIAERQRELAKAKE